MTRNQILSYISALDGWLSLHEGFFLYETAKKKGKGEIVEIGSWKGKSTICLAAGSKISEGPKITAIDPHKGEFTKNGKIGKKSPTFTTFKKNLEKVQLTSFVNPLVTTSKKAAQNWKKSVKFLFIDGLHNYKNTYQDYSLWSPFVANNGIIAFHDAFCGHAGPERVVSEEILSKNWKDIGVVGSIIFVQKGKPQTLMQNINNIRHKLLIPLALRIDKKSMPHWLKFFLIHRIIKFLLINQYTLLLQLGNE